MNTRTKALLGEAGVEKLARAHVAVFGIGGVGGYAVEALARSGVGTLTLVDGDTFSESNLNRQLYATAKTVGMPKVEAAKETLAAHAPKTRVIAVAARLDAQTVGDFPFSDYEYIVDAIDDLGAKVLLAQECARRGIPLICAMGAGNKLDPTAFSVLDLSKTNTDPLARRMRAALGKCGLRHVKTVCSKEVPRPLLDAVDAQGGKGGVGSVAFVVGAAGMALAGAVVCDLCGITEGYAPYSKEG